VRGLLHKPSVGRRSAFGITGNVSEYEVLNGGSPPVGRQGFLSGLLLQKYESRHKELIRQYFNKKK
jgi:hypothetical protein